MKRILLIEDDTGIRRNVEMLLRVEGYDVCVADNGAEGLRLAHQYRPDLILSDIMMPELDGYGVLTALREDPDQAAIPFIFLSAKSDRSDQRYGMKLGADDYLTKPFTREELLDSVNSRLLRRQAIETHCERRLSLAYSH